MAALLALQSSLHCLAVFCSAIADGVKASSPSNAADTAKVGFITHLSGKTPPNAYGLAATAPARRKLPRWQPQCGPQPLTGSVTIVRSLFLPCQEQRANGVIGKRRRPGAPPSDCTPLLPRGQCAVSVEESASTAGSVVTEVSVGLAFSSSHSIGSGLRVSARASTSSMRETGTMSRPFLMLSLISTKSLAFSSGISTVFM